MNAPERAGVLPEADHVKEHRGPLSVHPLRQELRPDERAAPRDPVGSFVPDECAAETFVGGAGI
jgi:hypothetical protein